MGQVIPGQYIVVLNDDVLNLRDILSEVAKKVNIEGTEILYIYEDVLNGFAIIPNVFQAKMQLFLVTTLVSKTK